MSFAELRDLLHVAAVNRAQECVADAAYNHAKVTLPPGPNLRLLPRPTRD